MVGRLERSKVVDCEKASDLGSAVGDDHPNDDGRHLGRWEG